MKKLKEQSSYCARHQVPGNILSAFIAVLCYLNRHRDDEHHYQDISKRQYIHNRASLWIK